MKVALVHDYLTQYGGAERVLAALCELFPRAPIYTLVYNEELTGGAFGKRIIRTSFIQKMPFSKKNHRLFSPLMPLAIEQFDLSYYDLVISDSSGYAKGIIAKPGTYHLDYCHTPLRYAWDDSHKYLEEFGFPKLLKSIIPFFISYLRIWDREASSRVDKFIANSEFVKDRIKKYYSRDSLVLNPPVDAARFNVSADVDDYFLMVGRLVAYKRFDLAVSVFNELGWKLKIIGDGPERKRLEKMAKSNIEFVGLVSDSTLPKYYSRARALIFPQEEDFGIVPLESMASGRPVIAFRGGGALETIGENSTGRFFDFQTVSSLYDAVRDFKESYFDSQYIRGHALKYDKSVFKQKFMDIVNNL
jgi:glycosyltransferase involved in cell wall biosynthesis